MTDVRLDNPGGCVAELTECNQEVAEFCHDWAADAGRLKTLEHRYKRLRTAAMRGTSGANADERAATAEVAIEEVAPGLAEEIEELIGKVAEYRTRFEAIERRSSNAQSILKAHREAGKVEEFVPREAREMARRAA